MGRPQSILSPPPLSRPSGHTGGPGLSPRHSGGGDARAGPLWAQKEDLGEEIVLWPENEGSGSEGEEGGPPPSL